MTNSEIEAANAKHNCCRIVRLSCGNYALFDPWSQEGMELIVIGSLAELEPHILDFEQVSAFAQDALASEGRSNGSGRSLLAEIGLVKTKEPLTRRF